MKVQAVIFISACLLFVNAHIPLTTCGKHFFSIINLPVFELSNPTKDYANRSRGYLVTKIEQLWKDKCAREISILASRNSNAASELYYANEDLQRSIGLLNQQINDNMEVGDRVTAYYRNFTQYFRRFKRAVIEAFKGVSDENCQKKLKDLQCTPLNNFDPKIYDSIAKIFVAFEGCHTK
eukprot:TRINITY_DN11547_c0_g1_i1.p1 TRINITY_DN11547_c0_g1~~TRINITY_DN11547_c0_g1_i1.p1  ORF type:complete len:180 (-),score=44.85 TRINITY_DN11547_c0_g1_i1:89-628(-)